MKSLLIGAGEVGSGLKTVLSETYPEVHLIDKEPRRFKNIEILHITFPYSGRFVKQVKRYIKQYQPIVTTIHSTVPVGTTRKCGDNVVHSPIRGKHPNIAKGIWTFYKLIGGTNPDLVKLVAKYFEKAKVSTKTFDKPETTELAKILDTTTFGISIVICKEYKEICDKLGLNFEEVYTFPNDTYNHGYSRLQEVQYIRPNLIPIPGPIGGHCIVSNAKLFKCFLTKWLLKMNKKYLKQKVSVP